MNRLAGRLGEFAILVFAIGAAGILVSQLARSVLTAPLERISVAMGRPPNR